MGRLYSLGKYQLIKRIAVGGMSEIFLASQGGLEGFERAVIIKCIREDLDTENEVKEMFLDEARIAACLKHPNIVHLYDVGRDGDTAYLAMEYIFGRDLMSVCERARMMGRELPIQVLVKIMCDTLAGLHYAHMTAEFEDKPLHMIHRDVSPQNIMLSFDGITKLMDFGIAKATARLSETRVGVLKGKYAYMSPEQVRGKPLDHRTDQFSLAVVVYEALTQTRLFQRETDYSTMEAVDQCEIPPIRVLRRDIPRRLMRVLKKAMRRKPKRRFSSAKEMERALHKLLKGSNVEQTERVAEFVRSLYGNELRAREQAIDDASDDERELILSTGFEMVSEKATHVGEPPEPPLAELRYKEILQQRQSAATEIREKVLQGSQAGVEVTPKPRSRSSRPRSDPMPEARPEQLDEPYDEGYEEGYDEEYEQGFDDDTEPVPAGQAETTARGKAPARGHGETTVTQRGASLLNDWRILVLIFLAVTVVAFFLLLTLGEREQVEVPAPDLGQPQPMKTTARPGIDGFISVSVGPHVRVILDDQKMGNGAFRMHPLQAGMHKVVLSNSRTGKKKSLTVNIRPDKEYLVAPMDYQ